jgi:hypothetical protein
VAENAKAKEAIHHVLYRIKNDPNVGWYLGWGTQSFQLLTEAASELFERPLDEVQEFFMPREAKDPRKEVSSGA